MESNVLYANRISAQACVLAHQVRRYSGESGRYIAMERQLPLTSHSSSQQTAMEIKPYKCAAGPSHSAGVPADLSLTAAPPLNHPPQHCAIITKKGNAHTEVRTGKRMVYRMSIL